jgi:hypothetical protein
MLESDINYTERDILDIRKSNDLIDIAYDINYGYMSMNNFLDKLIKIDDQFVSVFDRTNIDVLNNHLEFIINEIKYSEIDYGYPNRECYYNIITYLKIYKCEFAKLSDIYTNIVNSVYTDKRILYEILNFIITEIHNVECTDITIFITKNHKLIENGFFNTIDNNINIETLDLNRTVYSTVDRQTSAIIGVFRNIDINSPFYTFPRSRSRLTKALFIWASLG